MASKAVGILFGVLGEGSIDGKSGQLIKKQLEQIAKDIKPEVKIQIDEADFKSKLANIKKLIESEIGSGLVSKINQATQTTSGKTKNTKTKEQVKEYRELVRLQNEWRKAAVSKGSNKNQSGEYFKKQKRHADEAKKKFDEYRAQVKSLTDDDIANIDSMVRATEDLTKKTETLTAAKKKDVEASSKKAAIVRGQREIANASQLINSHKNLISRNKEAQELYVRLSAASDKYAKTLSDEKASYEQIKTAADEYSKEVSEITQRYNELEHKTNTVFKELGEKFSQKVLGGIVNVVSALLGNALRLIYQNVKNIDNAMGDLRIVTRTTSEEYEKFGDSIAKTAKKIGATVTDLIKSTTEFARLGYTLEEASIFAELTTVYSRVADVEINEATANLTAMVKAFGIQAAELEGVLDQLVHVGNEFAISPDEIGEGMNNAASALAANGNSIIEAMGILTAAQVTLQNASKSSTAVRTIAARISQSNAELIELGEDTEGILSTAKLQEKMSAFGVEIIDANGELRSTYAILNDLAGVWDALNTTSKSAIANMLAGVRQQNAFFSIMQNWQDAQSIVQNSGDATGALTEAQNTYLDTVEGRTQQLKATWEEFSRAMLDSNLVKDIIQLLTKLAKGLIEITKAGDGIISKILIIGTSVLTVSKILKLDKVRKGIDQITSSLSGLIKKLKITSKVGKNMSKFTTQQYVREIPNSDNSINNKGKLPREGTTSNLTDSVGNNTKNQGASFAMNVALTLMLILMTEVDEKWGQVVAGIVAGISAIAAAVLLLKGVIDPGQALTVIITAIIMLVKVGINAYKDSLKAQENARKKAEELAESLQKEADALREVSNAAKEACDSIDSLIDEFNELQNSTTSDWNDLLMGLGDEISKLYQDESLSEIEAINKLLDEQYTYSELINLSTAERANLLESIIDKSNKQKRIALEDTYIKQAEATIAEANANRIVSITYGDSETDEWDSEDFDKKTVKGKNTEAQRILESAGILSELKDYDKQLDFNIGDPDDIEGNIQRIETAIKKYQEVYKGRERALNQNAIYNLLNSLLSENKGALSNRKSAANDLIASIVEDELGLQSFQIKNAQPGSEKDIYKKIYSDIEDKVLNDATIKKALENDDIGINTIGQSIENEIASRYSDFYNKAKNIVPQVNASLMSTSSILDTMSEPYDALSEAMEEMKTSGALSADTISKLSELGLEDDFVERTEEGLYKLIDASIQAGGAVGKFLANQLDEYKNTVLDAQSYYNYTLDEYNKKLNEYNKMAPNLRTDDDYRKVLEAYNVATRAKNTLDDTISNANNALAAMLTMERENLVEQYNAILEKKQDALESELDKQKEIADIRKQILSTYQNEVNYQNEIERKQQNVSNLKTQLALANLDTSAAGQARTRELLSQVNDAEEDLEEYTLEKAIEEIQNGIDSEIEEYENFISGEVDALKEAIENSAKLSNNELKLKIEEEGDTLSAAISQSIQTGFQNAINSAKKSSSDNGSGSLTSPTALQHGGNNVQNENDIVDYDKISFSGISKNSPLGHNFTISYAGNSYEVELERYANNKEWDKIGTMPRDSIGIYDGKLFYKKKDKNKIYKLGKVERKINGRSGQEMYNELLELWEEHHGTYHTGGFVGDYSSLKSNEEFAKLLKGEFVTTPQQMDNFIKNTLPSLMNYHTTDGDIQFNSPLVTIECENVNDNTLPQLRELANEAARIVEGKMMNALTRSGYKKNI